MAVRLKSHEIRRHSLLATVPGALLEQANPADLTTVSITIVGPTGVTSEPKSFVIMGDETLQENIVTLRALSLHQGAWAPSRSCQEPKALVASRPRSPSMGVNLLQ